MFLIFDYDNTQYFNSDDYIIPEHQAGKNKVTYKPSQCEYKYFLKHRRLGREVALYVYKNCKYILRRLQQLNKSQLKQTIKNQVHA